MTLEPRQCEECGNTFQPIRRHKMYCSKRCQKNKNQRLNYHINKERFGMLKRDESQTTFSMAAFLAAITRDNCTYKEIHEEMVKRGSAASFESLRVMAERYRDRRLVKTKRDGRTCLVTITQKGKNLLNKWRKMIDA